MTLYRVRHISKRNGNSYDNQLVADSAAEAVAIREGELGISGDYGTYDVTVEPVPDPDGTRAAFWLRHFGEGIAR
jgi:hypothetical protein